MMAYLAQFVAVKVLAALAEALPLSVTFWVARRFGDLAFLLLKERRGIALSNLEKAVGNSLPQERKRQIIRAAFQHAALSMTELFTVQKIIKVAHSRFKFNGNEMMEKAFARGKGAILIVGHLGSWEYLEFLPFFTKRPWTVVVKDIKNPCVNKMIDDLRRKTTIVPIAKSGSIRTVLRELRKNHGVALLIDQWAGPEGLWVPFFNEPASTTSLPARLAKRTGAALVPAYCVRAGEGYYEIQICPEMPFDGKSKNWEEKTTQELNRWLERAILKHPDQWLWGHRRWKPKPSFLRTASGQEGTV